MASTTIDTETELSAVNSILGAIGQSPVTSIVKDNPEIGFIYNLLRDANVDIQAEGWHFNSEKHVQYTPDSVTGKIAIADDVIKLDVTNGWTHRRYDVVKRGGYLYDLFDHTDDWSDHTTIDLDQIKLITFEDAPLVFQRYIVSRASRMAATQLVANPQLVQMITTQEGMARATCIEYECNQANHSMFGFPEDTVYTTYQPWRNLRR